MIFGCTDLTLETPDGVAGGRSGGQDLDRFNTSIAAMPQPT